MLDRLELVAIEPLLVKADRLAARERQAGPFAGIGGSQHASLFGQDLLGRDPDLSVDFPGEQSLIVHRRTHPFRRHVADAMLERQREQPALLGNARSLEGVVDGKRCVTLVFDGGCFRLRLVGHVEQGSPFIGRKPPIPDLQQFAVGNGVVLLLAGGGGKARLSLGIGDAELRGDAFDDAGAKREFRNDRVGHAGDFKGVLGRPRGKAEFFEFESKPCLLRCLPVIALALDAAKLSGLPLALDRIESQILHENMAVKLRAGDIVHRP